ncbi:MAG: TetR/AcrR family transcriptional regulator [Myxococcales bacterium]|nr:TetR/AcrR family transcriptional regulator [Myxococcales bacterium]
MAAEEVRAGLASTAPDMRVAILEAAARLFADRGYSATSVRQVVEAAGCTKPTLYYYFRNKERLFLEVIETSMQRLDELVSAQLRTRGTVRERLARGLGAYLDHVQANPTVLRLLMTAERHPEQGQPFYDFDAFRQEHVDFMTGMLAEGVQAGELRPGLPLEDTVLALFGIVDHRLVLFLHGRALPPDFGARALDIFFHGVAA